MAQRRLLHVDRDAGFCARVVMAAESCGCDVRTSGAPPAPRSAFQRVRPVLIVLETISLRISARPLATPELRTIFDHHEGALLYPKTPRSKARPSWRFRGKAAGTKTIGRLGAINHAPAFVLAGTV